MNENENTNLTLASASDIEAGTANGITNKLVLGFAKANGDPIKQTYNYAKDSSTISTANVKSLMDGIIANGDIFENVPATKQYARVITTETTELDLS